MKKSLTIITSLIVLALAQTCLALDVDDPAPCVVLNHISVSNQESEHCIRDPESQSKAVVLDFFSITCSDCLASFPVVNTLAGRLGSVSTFRLVAIDRNEADVRKFIDTNRNLVTHEVALDLQRDAKKAYQVTMTPTVYVLNHDQQIVFKHVGIITQKVADQIQKLIESL